MLTAFEMRPDGRWQEHLLSSNYYKSSPLQADVWGLGHFGEGLPNAVSESNLHLVESFDTKRASFKAHVLVRCTSPYVYIYIYIMHAYIHTYIHAYTYTHLCMYIDV